MAQPDRKARPHFSQPVRQIILMLIALGLASFGAFVALPRVRPVFEANPYLNGFILFVFVIGVLACFAQVTQLIGSVRWIERFAAGEPEGPRRPPQLLAPLASLLRERGVDMRISATSTRSILDSVTTRIDEIREITRYIVNLLIFLGLLGTFYGLATTVPAVVDTIRSLAPQQGEEGIAVFNRLLTGLEAQLGGMGVAFASSLLGLAGSLIVGLLELFVGHGQNRFYRELEEWLSTITRVGFASGDGDESAAGAGAMGQLADQMDQLQHLVGQAEVSRADLDLRIGVLADNLARIADRMDRPDSTAEALNRVAAGQEMLVEALRSEGLVDGIDAESRMRLRSIDTQMQGIRDELASGRRESLDEIRAGVTHLTERLTRSPEGAAGTAVAARPSRQGEQGDG